MPIAKLIAMPVTQLIAISIIAKQWIREQVKIRQIRGETGGRQVVYDRLNGGLV